MRALTKLPKGKEATKEYLLRVIARGPACITAKIIDRLHNLRDYEGCTPEKRVKMIKETQEYHLRLLLPALIAHGRHWAKYADVLRAKINEAIEAIPAAS